MARFFLREKVGSRYFILSGGAPLGNEMHYQRTLGILDAFSSAYGVAFPTTRAELAMAEKPITVETERVTVTICPGYVSGEAFFQTAKEAFEAGEYDAVLSVLPPVDMIDVIGRTPLAVVDSYNTRNFQLFSGGTLKFVVGKYNSLVGPAFALMLNAVTGHAEAFRENGKAVKIAQNFWVSNSLTDYTDKYTLSNSPSMIAYSFGDLSRVITIYNKDASLAQLSALGRANSYEDVLVRRRAD